MNCNCVVCGVPIEAPNPNLACCSMCNYKIKKELDDRDSLILKKNTTSNKYASEPSDAIFCVGSMIIGMILMVFIQVVGRFLGL